MPFFFSIATIFNKSGVAAAKAAATGTTPIEVFTAPLKLPSRFFFAPMPICFLSALILPPAPFQKSSSCFGFLAINF